MGLICFSPARISMNLALFILWPPRCVQLQLIDTQSQVNKMTSVRLPSTCSRPGLCCEGLFFNLHGSLKSSPPYLCCFFLFCLCTRKFCCADQLFPSGWLLKWRRKPGWGILLRNFQQVCSMWRYCILRIAPPASSSKRDTANLSELTLEQGKEEE